MRIREEADDECGGDWRQSAGGVVFDWVDRVAQDAAVEAADGGIWGAENVSGVRVDYTAGEGGVFGVWKSFYEQSGT
jgi:hypothetical protein